MAHNLHFMRSHSVENTDVILRGLMTIQMGLNGFYWTLENLMM